MMTGSVEMASENERGERMRLTDADELLSLYEGEDENLRVSLRVVKENIKDMPTIEAEPIKHGEWIGCSDGTCLCSRCLETNEPTNYCPNCGAKMDKVKE